MDKIIALPQFEILEKHRKNAKHLVLKEEERVVGILKSLHQEKRIIDNLLGILRPRVSQPARLYGLAKVHRADTPMRPVLPDRFLQPRVHKTSGDLNAVVSGDLPPST